MNNNQILEFESIINKLENYTFTRNAKIKVQQLQPLLSETELRTKLRETTEARIILDEIGTPPMTSMDGVSELLMVAEKGGMLLASQLEYIETCFTSIARLKDFLKRCKRLENGLAYYSDDLFSFDDLRKEIQDKIRNGAVDDYASNTLKDIRRNIVNLEDKIKQKAEGMLRNNSEIYSDTFVVTRNGHICLPVKKDYKFRVNGSIIDKSSTGATLFIEPTEIAKLIEELQLMKLDEENEVIRILYELTGLLADVAPIFQSNLELIEKLDFIFAKGKLSVELKAKEPQINTGRYIKIKRGRHPLLNIEECVPLDFEIGNGISGVVITGPNTGGKTVAIKTVGLLSVMAQCGLHIPCEHADICMNSQVLCDIGDGQNITENLSTFSSHIVNVLGILKKVNNESLVILDELGSGTDPAEGMGIAVAILEQLKKSGCLFLATTHYPEVKVYAQKEDGIVNARMEFDRDTLKPLYRLEIGKAGESCALYIARHLGMPDDMLIRAGIEAYGEKAPELLADLELDWTNNNSNNNNYNNINSYNNNSYNNDSNNNNCNNNNNISFNNKNNNKKLSKEYTPRIQKKLEPKIVSRRAARFQIGDSVLVYPEKKIGIVAGKANAKGEIIVQLKKQKILVNHKRLQVQVAASELYPEDYDFSIVFDTVANRKARHKMSKGYQPGLEIKLEE